MFGCIVLLVIPFDFVLASQVLVSPLGLQPAFLSVPDSNIEPAWLGLVWLAYRVEVVVVFPRFYEVKDVLIGVSEPVLDARGHNVGLVPDDIIPQDPLFIDQSQGYSPRNSYQTLLR